MRLLPLICVVLLLGCAKSKPPASESAATGGTGAAVATLSLADVAGTWEGPVLAAGTDTVLTNVVLIATTEPTGWTMKVTNAKLPARTALVTAAGKLQAAFGDWKVPWGDISRMQRHPNFAEGALVPFDDKLPSIACPGARLCGAAYGHLFDLAGVVVQ